MAQTEIAHSVDDLFKPEPLCSDLMRYLTDGRIFKGTQSLCHPLVIEPIYHKELNGWLNKMYAQKTRAIAEALSKRDWSRIIWYHERPYRLDAFISLLDGIPDR